MSEGAAPQPAELPGKWNVGRIIRRFSGVDEKLLAWVPQERARYTGLGGTVLTTAIMACISMAFALSLAFATRNPIVIIPALLWGVLILNFDRWLVSTPLASNPWRRIPTILVRFAMAFVFGIVIAEPLVLAVFATAVDQQVKDSRADDIKQFLARWETCNPQPLAAGPPAAGCETFVVPPPEGVPAMQQEMAQKAQLEQTLKAQLVPLDQRHNDLVTMSQNECLGVPGQGRTGSRGNGPVCQRLLNDAINFAQINRIDELKQQVTTLAAEQQALTTKIGAASAAWGEQRRTFIDTKVAERVANQKEIGLLERIEALNALAASHASLALGIWTVRALFILVDCAPAIAKFTSGATVYDRLAQRRLGVGEIQHATLALDDTAAAHRWAQFKKDSEALERARSAADRMAKQDELLDEVEERWAQEATARGFPAKGSRYSYGEP